MHINRIYAALSTLHMSVLVLRISCAANKIAYRHRDPQKRDASARSTS